MLFAEGEGAFQARLFRSHGGEHKAAALGTHLGMSLDIFGVGEENADAGEVIHGAGRRLFLVPGEIIREPIAAGDGYQRQNVKDYLQDIPARKLGLDREIGDGLEGIHSHADRHRGHDDEQNKAHDTHDYLGDRGLGIAQRMVPAPAGIHMRGKADGIFEFFALFGVDGRIDVLRSLLGEEKIESTAVCKDLRDGEKQRERGEHERRYRRKIIERKTDKSQKSHHGDRAYRGVGVQIEFLDHGFFAAYPLHYLGGEHGSLPLFFRSRKPGTRLVDYALDVIVGVLCPCLCFFFLHNFIPRGFIRRLYNIFTLK